MKKGSIIYLSNPEVSKDNLKDLENIIYNLLISNPDIGLGELGECRDAAHEVVEEWIELTNIKVTE